MAQAALRSWGLHVTWRLQSSGLVGFSLVSLLLWWGFAFSLTRVHPIADDFCFFLEDREIAATGPRVLTQLAVIAGSPLIERSYLVLPAAGIAVFTFGLALAFLSQLSINCPTRTSSVATILFVTLLTPFLVYALPGVASTYDRFLWSPVTSLAMGSVGVGAALVLLGRLNVSWPLTLCALFSSLINEIYAVAFMVFSVALLLNGRLRSRSERVWTLLALIVSSTMTVWGLLHAATSARIADVLGESGSTVASGTSTTSGGDVTLMLELIRRGLFQSSDILTASLMGSVGAFVVSFSLALLLCTALPLLRNIQVSPFAFRRQLMLLASITVSVMFLSQALYSVYRSSGILLIVSATLGFMLAFRLGSLSRLTPSCKGRRYSILMVVFLIATNGILIITSIAIASRVSETVEFRHQWWVREGINRYSDNYISPTTDKTPPDAGVKWVNDCMRGWSTRADIPPAFR